MVVLLMQPRTLVVKNIPFVRFLHHHLILYSLVYEITDRVEILFRYEILCTNAALNFDLGLFKSIVNIKGVNSGKNKF